MRLLLFSDLHLDVPFNWHQPEIARRRRQRLRDVLRKITSLASQVGAQALLCGGDLYEHDRFSPDTGEFLRQTFAELDPMLVYLAPGNHDWLAPGSLYRTIRWPSNVLVFQDYHLKPVTLADGLTLWGAAHCAPANTNGFLEGFKLDRGGIHLALFHGSERGSLSFQETGKIAHAPFNTTDLERCGIHHALLGHYHAPRDAERFTYPGNPEPLTFGEEGCRGPVVITVQQDGTVVRERHRLAIMQLHDVNVDITNCSSQQEIRDRIRDAVQALQGVVRVTLTGSVEPEVDLRVVEDIDDKPQGIEDLQIQVGNVQVAFDFEAIRSEPTVRGQFVRDVLAAAELNEEERRRVLITGLRALAGRDDLSAL